MQQLLKFPVAMRAVPAASYAVIAEANIYGGERAIAPSSAAAAVASIRASAQGRAYASFDAIAFDAEL